MTAIAECYYAACAVLFRGTVQCWGDNEYGQLGNGATLVAGYSPPGVVSGLSGVTTLAMSSFHTCALLSWGAVECWGWNSHGQLGDGTMIDSSTPVTVKW